MNAAGLTYAQDVDVDPGGTVMTAMRRRHMASVGSVMRLDERRARSGDCLRAPGGSAFGGVEQVR